MLDLRLHFDLSDLHGPKLTESMDPTEYSQNLVRISRLMLRPEIHRPPSLHVRRTPSLTCQKSNRRNIHWRSESQSATSQDDEPSDRCPTLKTGRQARAPLVQKTNRKTNQQKLKHSQTHAFASGIAKLIDVRWCPLVP